MERTILLLHDFSHLYLETLGSAQSSHRNVMVLQSTGHHNHPHSGPQTVKIVKVILIAVTLFKSRYDSFS